VLQDLRFALRLMARARWFTAMAVMALALGIGANATIYTIFHAALVRGLPFRDAGRLATVSLESPSGNRVGVSSAELADWRAQTRAFTGLAAFRQGSVSVSDDHAAPEQADAAWLTANAFGVLDQPPLIGRAFAAGDDTPGANPVVILGHRLWTTRYGADPAVLGRLVRLNGRPGTIVGVMPAHVRFPINAELWAPFIPTEAQRARDARDLSAFARLRDEVSFAEARAEMTGLAQRFAAAYPDTNRELTSARVETFTERFVGGAARPMFIAMMGAVSFVLLIACANVANLLLSRSAARAQEVAVRMALGATRPRVLRQLLIESLLLGAIGGVLGLAIAMIAVPIFDASVTDPGKPFWIVFKVDYAIVGYVAGVCVATALLFGFAPALHVSRTDLNGVLNEGGRSGASSLRLRRFSAVMVVTQLALTAVLLVGAGLMMRSFVNALRLDVGMDTSRLMAMRLSLPASRYETAEARRLFFERLGPRLSGLPGVEGATWTTSLPLTGTTSRSFEIDGKAVFDKEADLSVSIVTVGAPFFEVSRVPVLRGRAFGDIDGAPGSETVIVNQRFAIRYFPGEDPVGRRLRFIVRGDGPASVWRTIIGVSGTVWHSSLRGDEPGGVIYVPARQEPPASSWLLLRSPLEPASVMTAVQRAVQDIDRDQPVSRIQTLDDRIAEQRWALRVFGLLLGIFATLALVLAAVGLYAVMAYSVQERTREIGVRMAFGAGARDVTWLVLRRGLVQLAVGLVLGLLGAFALSRVLRRSLVQVAPGDPWTFAGIAVLLIVVAMAACLVPARRAARVDPLAALRAN
jgi:putative ABC transport system permease protein